MKNSPEIDGLHITETAEGVTFSLHVQPKACRNEIYGLSGNELKVRLTSPPVEGAANKLCQEFFAKLLHVANQMCGSLPAKNPATKLLPFEEYQRKPF